MKDKNISTGKSESLLKPKEEYAHEFGIHHSVQESDAMSNMTKKLLNRKKNKKQENTVEKIKRTNSKDHSNPSD
ncbi:hypothetical protein [Halalkalibacter alkaliphilus]|uniref:Uncharacterized protein n=1 Tax=Halalkalibacter alkaliphilus TaxID=2917993 RepID=A0A9X1ZY09_9BACI|nr:hypothetical protein [Halalkalibacter alkaliphilus]MCL7746451.1 hypothetical protein [Halalkalibacter alkaliphilus]